VNWEGALYADAETDLADRESLLDARTLTTDNDALEDLDALAGTFNDSYVDLEGVTGTEGGDVVTH
jgi:hypothetical protein